MCAMHHAPPAVPFLASSITTLPPSPLVSCPLNPFLLTLQQKTFVEGGIMPRLLPLLGDEHATVQTKGVMALRCVRGRSAHVAAMCKQGRVSMPARDGNQVGEGCGRVEPQRWDGGCVKGRLLHVHGASSSLDLPCPNTAFSLLFVPPPPLAAAWCGATLLRC